MIRVISGSPGLPDYRSVLFVNLPEFYLLCWLGGVTPSLPVATTLNGTHLFSKNSTPLISFDVRNSCHRN